MGNIAAWFAFKDEWFFKGTVESHLNDLVRQIEELTTLLGSFGPFVDVRIYDDIQELLSIALRYHRIAVTKMNETRSSTPLPPVLLDRAYPKAFAEVRQQLFKSVADRIKELSQYDRPTEPGPL